ncbi:hypothetical protein [Devosia sp. 2618]|uniref:hypothetical protein n=1 Tax=Devosia sp. 2618 TaxID=3156454 RepID=UPI003399AECE
MAEVDTTPYPSEQPNPLGNWIVIALLWPLVSLIVLVLTMRVVAPGSVVDVLWDHPDFAAGILAIGWVFGLLPAALSGISLYAMSPRLPSRGLRALACVAIGATMNIVSSIPGIILLTSGGQFGWGFAFAVSFSGAVALLVTGVRWSVR